MKDPRLFASLNEVKDTLFHEVYLKGLLEDAAKEIDEAMTDREAAIGIGKRRILKQILKDIEDAYDAYFRQQKETELRKAVDMKKAF